MGLTIIAWAVLIVVGVGIGYAIVEDDDFRVMIILVTVVVVGTVGTLSATIWAIFHLIETYGG
ncbi:hypothetical protein DRO27_02810 [Candidatus Bathyarchaeota archaeon]|nr:MAG: hypothetical protein DRO27_02810 [Candidatus Bathyarchaeota archaeon]